MWTRDIGVIAANHVGFPQRQRRQVMQKDGLRCKQFLLLDLFIEFGIGFLEQPVVFRVIKAGLVEQRVRCKDRLQDCLLYTSDAADE